MNFNTVLPTFKQEIKLTPSDLVNGRPGACATCPIARRTVAALRARFRRYDVSHLAKMYGGGGHKNAAGFQSSELHAFVRGGPTQPTEWRP